MKLLIADDHAVVREGLKQILAESFSDATLAEARSTWEVLALVEKENWDLILLDLNMPGRGGLDALKEIHRIRPGTKVLVISVHSEDQYGQRVLRSGGSGFVSKASAPEKLVEAVNQIMSGGTYFGPAVAEKATAGPAAGTPQPLHETLSNREFQVLCLIASGKAVTEIGTELSLSVKTVSTYRTRILEKMQMKTNAELTQYAMRHRLVGPEG